MFFIGAIIAGAVLGGGAAYAIQEADKNRLKKANSGLETQNYELGERLRQATEKEIKNRIEKNRLLLMYYQARVEKIFGQTNVSPIKFARLAATAEQLVVVGKRIDSEGYPQDGDKAFVEILHKIMSYQKNNGERPTKSEMAQLDSYLEAERPGAMIRTLKEIFSQKVHEYTHQIKSIQEDISNVEVEISKVNARIRSEYAPTALKNEKMNLMKDLNMFQNEMKDKKIHLSEVRLSLVVLTQLSDKDTSLTQIDGQAQKIIMKKFKGRRISTSEKAFLEKYEVANFSAVRKRLQKQGISILVAK